MDIQFLGGTKTVTGSKYLLKTDKKILVDCGLYQGLKELRLRNWDDFPVDPSGIDAIVLTHLHMDHIGYLPVIVKNGFKGKIYCTHQTKELCQVLLLDGGHIQEEEARHANKHGYSKHKKALPLYTRADARAVFPRLVGMSFHQEFAIGNTKFRYNRAGHVFGAACVLVQYLQTSILFSGDLGRANDPCIFPPENIATADYLVIESTYGNRLHEDIDPKEQLADVVRSAIARGGAVVIPAFAVGRTQTILYYLHQLKQEGKIPNNLPVFLDSPMANEITAMVLDYERHNKNHKKGYLEAFRGIKCVCSQDESKKIDTYTFPRVIVSSSGMLTGGRVLHHIKMLAGNHNNAILLCGYQAAGTRGSTLLSGEKRIKFFGEYIDINAEITLLKNISAHVDYKEMLNWLRKIPFPPRRVFITHGEPKACEFLRNEIIKELGWQCIIPEYLQTENLL